MEGQWTCPRHLDQPISFLCTGNVWHFEPLCNVCVPEHTKTHPKHIKIQLESVVEVRKKAADIKVKVQEILQERLQKGVGLLDVPHHQFDQIKGLQEKRNLIVKEINLFFDVLISDTKKQQQNLAKQQREGLEKLIVNLEERVNSLQQQQIDLSQFCKSTRTYYFKDGFGVYVEEFDEILREYQESVIRRNSFVWPKDLQNTCRAFIKNLYRLEGKIEKSNQSEKVQKKENGGKKQTKKNNKKRCPQCRGEMEYLTEWKKHLVCPNCGQKERNYVKRS